MLMVKPGIFYLDIIRNIKQKHSNYPLFAYQVKFELSFIMHFFKLTLVVYTMLTDMPRDMTCVME